MLDIKNENTINHIIAEIEGTEERDRKRQAYDSYQVFSGNIYKYVQNELQKTRPKSYKSYTISDISLSKMVVSKLSKAYKEKPIREVSSDDFKTEMLNVIYESANADRQFKEFDHTLNRDRHALFWVNYRKDKNKYEFMSLAPYEFSVVRNKDFGELEAVILQYPDTSITSTAGDSRGGAYSGDGVPGILAENQADSGGQCKVYAIWTDTDHVVVKVTSKAVGNEVKRSITYVPIEDNPNNVNPIGKLPFVYVSKDNSPDYPTINPITDQTITFNVLWSELLTAANIQGTGQLIVKYPQEMQGQLDTLVGGLTQAIELPQLSDPNAGPTDATYINPSPDLAGQQDAYSNYLRLVLSEHGITTSQGIEGSAQQFTSGLDRLIANADVQSIISENQQTFYAGLESSIFEILKAWEKITGGKRFSDEDYLVVRYSKPKVLVSDAETLQNIKQRLELGLIERWEALTMLDPNLDESGAKEKLNRIELEKFDIARTFLNGRQNNQDNRARFEQDSDVEEITD